MGLQVRRLLAMSMDAPYASASRRMTIRTVFMEAGYPAE
jgi:hypothetical protein